MENGLGLTSRELSKDERLGFLAADFVAQTPLLDSLSLESRAEAVHRTHELLFQTEQALTGAPEGANVVKYIGRTFNDSDAMAIVARERVADGKIVCEVSLWKIDELRDYRASREEKQ